jgi:hypothetical protein
MPDLADLADFFRFGRYILDLTDSYPQLSWPIYPIFVRFGRFMPDLADFYPINRYVDRYLTKSINKAD